MAELIYGATPDQWSRFESLVGAKDLLPVVSNPQARVSSTSNLVDVGKVPSQYTRDGEVVGISAWTTKEMTSANVARFMRQPDYGICVQTRDVRAIDIDVIDAFVADDIEQYVKAVLGDVSVRRRSNSSKCLMMFRLAGEWGKRRLEVEGGIVEILMNGQQFIAVGTHPSGVRYEWDGEEGLPREVVELDADSFESLWSGLVETFGLDGGAVGVYRERSRGLSVVLDDPIRDHLVREGLVLSSNSAGDVFIACPWRSEHSDPDAAPGTSTVWMTAGSNGHGAGHFKCLHAHCSGRTDDEFIEAIGADSVVDQVVIDLFPVESGSGSGGDEDIGGRTLVFKRNDKTGEILSEFSNIVVALEYPPFVGFDLAFDEFRDEVMISRAGLGEWLSFADHHYTELWLRLVKRGFKELDYAKIRHAVAHVAMSHRFDSAKLWLSGLVWDGIPRVETFLIRYMGCADDAYIRSVSRYMWTALAGRVMQPGIKADMVPVFIGKQGAGKSTAVAALSPAPEFHGELSLSDKDAELSRRIRGKMVLELAELKGMRGAHMEFIKAFIARVEEESRKLYKECYSKFYRRCVFFGTTNEYEFLSDETGNRRFSPVEVGECLVDEIKRDILLIWAEAREMFNVGGIEYAIAEQLGADVHVQYMLSDPWDVLLEQWIKSPHPLDGHIPERDGIVINDFLKDILGFDDKNITRREQLRVGGILSKMGFERVSQRVEHKVVKRWVMRKR